MTTTLIAAATELSKQIGDYWASTTTGAGSTTTMVDTALLAKANDWVTDEAYAILMEEPTGDAAIYDERKVSSLDNTTGTLTTLAFAGTPGSGTDYELHRLFSPSEKRRALVYAARHCFPYLFTQVRDESMVSGNWLKNGSFEKWTTSTNCAYWTETTLTATQTTTSPYYKHGATSAKLGTLAGRISQSITDYDDLKMLAGKNVTLSVQGWCNTASCLRIQIYDGTTTTTSDYHDGNSTWTENDDPLEKTVTIADNPTEITFRILHDVATGTSYVDDARVISGDRSRLYIGDLGLARHHPHQVLLEQSDYSEAEPWYLLHNWSVDEAGNLHLPASASNDFRLRIIGQGYLDFLASGVSSTAWTATIAVDSPQLDILVAEAILYLCKQKIQPNEISGESKRWQEAYAFWNAELKLAQSKYAMTQPNPTVHWR